jgi:hypothetical protein
MAKKKSATSGETGNGPQPAAQTRKRSARKGVAPADQSPISGGASTTSEEVQLAVAHDGRSVASGPDQPSYQEIAEAAYQRYLRRGGVDGQDFDDWLAAERELIARHSAKP